jgi:hypothetical protein
MLVAGALAGAASWVQISWLKYAIVNVQQGVPLQLTRVQAFTHFASLAVLFAGFSIAVACIAACCSTNHRRGAAATSSPETCGAISGWAF